MNLHVCMQAHGSCWWAEIIEYVCHQGLNGLNSLMWVFDNYSASSWLAEMLTDLQQHEGLKELKGSKIKADWFHNWH